jgi:DNA-binding transcriptional MerR regulator
MSTAGAGQGHWQDAEMPGLGEAGSPADDGAASRLKKAPHAFRTISEVADELHVPQHVLRFWETRFSQVRPLKRGGGRRYYRPDDIELLRRISDLLYVQGYTIKGVQRMLREGGDPGSPAFQGVLEPDDEDDLFQPQHLSAAGALDEAAGEGEAMVPDDRSVAESAHIEDIEGVAVLSDTGVPTEISHEESVAGSSDIERIRRENVLLKDSLRGVLVELQALRRLIPV